MLDFNIITFHRSINFGAALQAFALQEFVAKQGYSVGIFDYKKPKATSLKPTFRSKVNNALAKITQDEKDRYLQYERFSSFREKYFRLNLETNSRVFITGSDQVWNLNNSMDSMFFLTFLENRVYKASYAASMAKSVIPEAKRSVVVDYLNTIDSISVRETSIKDSLSQLCNKEISVNVDPTLLHEKSFYSSIAVQVKCIPEKYILAYILHIPKNGNKLLRWLHHETGLPIVLLDSSGNIGIVIKNDVIIRNAGPLEFIYLFKNAECVVTTSFHGTCFSLIFEKEFYSIVNPDSPSRISSLLSKFNINPINESDAHFIRNNNIEWGYVRQVLEQERQYSKEYIYSVFEASKRKQSDQMNGTVAFMKNKCTGCAACEEICPTGAIRMVLNSNGFYEPSVDENKCVNCSKCIRLCPINKKLINWPQKAYCGWNVSREVLYRSSSGGAFYSLAKVVMNKSGVVFGATFTEDWKDVVCKCTEEVALEKIQKSKYTVSTISGAYKSVKRYLDEGRIVLFTGTPCQCAGIKSVFGDKYNNLITCDFVCGGMASLSFYQEHINLLQKKFGSVITSVDFRPKDWGWGRYHIYVRFKNGQKYIKRDFADAYFKCFITKASVRHVCEECPYYHFHRSDFTIADFWGYKSANFSKNSDGMSMVVCNNAAAEKIFEEVNDFEKHEIPIENIQYTIRDKIPNMEKIKERDRFFALSKEKGFETAALEMYDLSEINHYVNKVKTILHI